MKIVILRIFECHFKVVVDFGPYSETRTLKKYTMKNAERISTSVYPDLEVKEF